MDKIIAAIENRPTESLTGPALGLVVFGFATQVGIPLLAAGIVAVAVAFVPVVISNVVDAVRE